MAKGNGAFDPEETIAARIPIGEMVIDSYQGHLNQALVDRIAKKWDESAAGAIILNLRDDGTYAVLDGQHRVKAAAQRGVRELAALVFIGKSKQEEARLFVMLNTKHNVSAIDRFRANLEAGGIPEKNIRAALRELELDVALNGPGDDRVQCASVLLRIYNERGLAQFKLIAGILQSAYHKYPDRARGYRADAFSGLDAFLLRYPEADTALIIDVLRTKGPTVMGGYAAAKRGRGEDGATGWGKALLELYNDAAPKGARLGEWKSRVYSPDERERKAEMARRSPLIQSTIKNRRLSRIRTENHIEPTS